MTSLFGAVHGGSCGGSSGVVSLLLQAGDDVVNTQQQDRRLGEGKRRESLAEELARCTVHDQIRDRLTNRVFGKNLKTKSEGCTRSAGK